LSPTCGSDDEDQRDGSGRRIGEEAEMAHGPRPGSVPTSMKLTEEPRRRVDGAQIEEREDECRVRHGECGDPQRPRAKPPRHEKTLHQEGCERCPLSTPQTADIPQQRSDEPG